MSDGVFVSLFFMLVGFVAGDGVEVIGGMPVSF